MTGCVAPFVGRDYNKRTPVFVRRWWLSKLFDLPRQPWLQLHLQSETVLIRENVDCAHRALSLLPGVSFAR